MTGRLRCAIYTRKSSEEGLEQDFNSLHAQREACEAYIKSQVAEGWAALATSYDDGGFSGGSLIRPGLERLLADIAVGRVDVVVVYKVDRLTRSLTDFARIVEAFDHRGVSFVSVTQAFNTTSSMGRLTLNVLLSFAQFEREVTGERIRDKIAASKAKGMWMGGMTPLGYDIAGRSLAINPSEADLVRHIFDRYLELPSVRDLAQELVDAGIRSKCWTTRSGRVVGGARLSLGALRHILVNRLYLGEIVHKGQSHPGKHAAIVTSARFEAVTAKLTQGATLRKNRAIRAQSGPLTGKLFDAAGRPMSPSFGYGRAGRIYRYYVTAPASPDASGGTRPPVVRLSAPETEQFLLGVLRRLSGRDEISEAELSDFLVRVEAKSAETHVVIDASVMFRGQPVELGLEAIRRRLKASEGAAEIRASRSHIHIVLPQRLRLRGGQSRIHGAGDEAAPRINAGIVDALKRAHRDLTILKASPLSDPAELRNAAAPLTHHQRQLSRLAFLSPILQRRILSGRQPQGLYLSAMLTTEMPLAWSDQLPWLENTARPAEARLPRAAGELVVRRD